MTGLKTTAASQRERWKALSLKEAYPELSCRQIAKHMHRHHTFVSKWIKFAQLHDSVDDQPRSGRPAKLSSEEVQHILTLVQQKQCKSAAAITAKVE